MAWVSLMTADGADRTHEAELTLRGRMADLALVSPWIERLASEYGIPASTQFAMNLCLEEVISNIIRHGYAGRPEGPVTVRCTATGNDSIQLVVEDSAPHFNPLEQVETPVADTLDGTRIGGLGIRLIRKFAATIKYEPTAAGNRLTIGFSFAS